MSPAAGGPWRAVAARLALLALAVASADAAGAEAPRTAPAPPSAAQEGQGSVPRPDPLRAPATSPPTSPPERVPVPDSLTAGAVRFLFWPESRLLARDLAERSTRMPPLPALPAPAPGAPIRVYLAPDEASFATLTGGRAPEWGAGVAFPASGTIVLPAYASRRGPAHGLPRVLRHELAHVALARYLAPAEAPRWFDEGYARYAAGEWDAEAAWKLRLAFALGRAPPLDSLELGWPRAALDAEVAYLLSATTIGYLVDRGGDRGLALFLGRWRESASLDRALRETYGVTLSQFEQDWRAHVRSSYGWGVFLTHSLVFWLFAAVLILVLYAIRRRRDRERLRHLRATEPPDRPAYWAGEESWPPPSDSGGPGPGESPPEGGPPPWPTTGTSGR